MKRLHMPPAIRLTLGLTLLTVTILLGVEMFGILPDPREVIVDSRKKICESLAVSAVMAIQEDNFDSIQTTMDVLKQRNQDILSTALRNDKDKIIVQSGDHQCHWLPRQGPQAPG